MIQKPHAVCIPYPTQGHINPMLNLAKLLHHRGFHVTFVNTEYNHGPSSLDGLPSFHKFCLPYFKDLLQRPNEESATSGSPLVSCMVSNGAMTFTLNAVEAIGVLEVLLREGERAKRASAIILNTFDRLEHEVLDALKAMFPPIYTLGPLHLLTKQLFDNNTRPFRSNLWKEEPGCIEWLDSKQPSSVMYVNFGSITVMSPAQLVEFAWGLMNNNQAFLWVIRPDLCSQEGVLSRSAVGGFLTHSGWNSTIESIAAGVPVVCWPFVRDQQTNCWYNCQELGIGMEIDKDVKRNEVERQVKELMEGEKRKEMKRKVMEWKEMAREATRPSGSSFLNLDEVINKVLLSPRRD
ncbi:hypothetical protein EUGRSUZ_F00342 [Eucalyptus grandis]|uniref:Uncharacterized protein n=2 Tax=Eucalyptus grandis TaxID=71139 RepID=A0ACC3KBQ8_EUCGR|nr:hypothetical protein EUGRSUZ_F00342 [Eucalyptus grandis]